MALMPKASQILTDSQVTNSTNHYGFKAVRDANDYTSDHEQLSQMTQSQNELARSGSFPNARAMTLE